MRSWSWNRIKNGPAPQHSFFSPWMTDLEPSRSTGSSSRLKSSSSFSVKILALQQSPCHAFYIKESVQCCQVPPCLHCHFSPKWRPFWHLSRPLCLFSQDSNISVQKYMHITGKLHLHIYLFIKACLLVFFIMNNVRPFWNLGASERTLSAIFVAIRFLKTVMFKKNDRDNNNMATLLLSCFLSVWLGFYTIIFYGHI
jgi:hypothetical protein